MPVTEISIKKESAFFQITTFNKLLVQKIKHCLSSQDVDIRVDQLVVLLAIYENGLTQKEIASEVGRDKSSVLRTINALEKDGLIKIVQDQGDKRKNRISLTESGTALADNVKDKIENLEKILFSNMKGTDREKFIHSLKNIGENIQNIHFM